MNGYIVTLGEVISHSIQVEAESKESAIELAKQLIGNEHDEYLKHYYGYEVGTVGWDGYEEAEVSDAS
jgi:hypothetical protein